MFDTDNKVNMWYTVHCHRCVHRLSFFEWPLSAVFMSHTGAESDFLTQPPHTGSVTEMEADGSFDPLHVSFNLSTCVSEYGMKKMEITFISNVLTGCHSHSHCSIQPPTTDTETHKIRFCFFFFCQGSFILLNVVGVMWNTRIWGREWWDISLDLCSLLSGISLLKDGMTFAPSTV